jgi:cbb3-type cytochrome oxidase subunit 3
MNDLIKSVLAGSGLSLGPSIAVLVFFLTMLLIITWTLRPKAKHEYEQQGKLTLD